MILVLTSGDLRIDYAQRVQISLTPQHSAREVRPLTTPHRSFEYPNTGVPPYTPKIDPHEPALATFLP